jgi:hypothetical protein
MGLLGALACACTAESARPELAEAARRAADERTARVITRTNGTFSGVSGRSRFSYVTSGVFDFRRGRGILSLVVRAGSGAGEDVIVARLRMVRDGGDVYIAVPDSLSERTDRKPWLRIRQDDLVLFGGFELTVPNLLGLDPTAYLDVLVSAAKRVERGGEANLKGLRARRYRARVDLGEALTSRIPEANREAARRAFRQLGIEVVPVDIWLDRSGRPVQVGFRLGAEDLTQDFLFEFSDYGMPVSIAVPAARDTYVSQNQSELLEFVKEIFRSPLSAGDRQS